MRDFEVYKDELIMTARVSMINRLCLLVDGIPCIRSGKKVFYRVSDVIAWHQNELPHTSEKRASARKSAIRMFEGLRDEVEYTDTQIKISNPHPMTKTEMKLLLKG